MPSRDELLLARLEEVADTLAALTKHTKRLADAAEVLARHARTN